MFPATIMQRGSTDLPADNYRRPPLFIVLHVRILNRPGFAGGSNS